MRLSTEQIVALAMELQGTCQNLEEALEKLELPPYDDIDVESLSELDSRVFLCDVCDWWFECCEMSEASADTGRQVCLECEVEGVA